jgi:hypothetical protein
VRAALSAAAMAMVVLAGGVARADDAAAVATAAEPDTSGDGYCEFMEGTAQAASDLLYAPSVIGSIGYVKDPTVTDVNAAVSAGVRAVAGLQYNFIGIPAGNATRALAHADCARHQALDRVQGETVYRALRAKKKVLDDAMDEADKVMSAQEEDLKQHRITAQEVVATRLRVNDLHDLLADTQRQLDSLPAPVKGEALGGALGAYYRADAEMEEQTGRLRRLSAFDVTARVGYDQYLDRADNSPLFAVVQVTVNLGNIWLGDANDRAAAGRKKALREQHQVQLVDTTITHIKREIEQESARADETAALEQDLQSQIAQLDKIGGDDNKRYRQTVWFDFIKVKAEKAYYATHVTSLKEVVGQVGE